MSDSKTDCIEHLTSEFEYYSTIHRFAYREFRIRCVKGRKWTEERIRFGIIEKSQDKMKLFKSVVRL